MNEYLTKKGYKWPLTRTPKKKKKISPRDDTMRMQREEKKKERKKGKRSKRKGRFAKPFALP